MSMGIWAIGQAPPVSLSERMIALNHAPNRFGMILAALFIEQTGRGELVDYLAQGAPFARLGRAR
jgi:hypothetical protein